MVNFLFIDEFPESLDLERWYCSLLWCPSQCYMHVQDQHGTHFILYLRWRWNDPWQAHIIRNAYNEQSMRDGEAEWSGNVFEGQGLYFVDEELEDAKQALLNIWRVKVRESLIQ